MAIGPRGVMRSEVEGGLTGPANPIPEESIDCGCGQLPCPKLARFATRRFFLGLVGCIGFMQSAAQTYMQVTSPSIARRFQLNPHVIEWIVVLPEMTPVIFGLLVAYWGDRIHRVAWTGGLVIIQGIAYISLIIPHLTSKSKIIEEPSNVTHMSLYSDDSPELCSPAVSLLVIKETSSGYLALALIIGVQILAGIAQIAYYALTLSYLDDNTKKKSVAIYISIVLAVRSLGVLKGYVLAYFCLRIDADNFHPVESYQEQIGAWWIGWPLLGLNLLIPGIILAIFPRRLPSEIVEQAAASILDSVNGSRRSSFKSYRQVFESSTFLSSIGRFFENKILIFNTVAGMFVMAALVNFMANEHIFLESRYYIPRPTGMFVGFGDPWTSRLLGTTLKPVIVGFTVVITGVIIARARPQASYVAGYNVFAVAITATIFLALAFATCEKPSIVGMRRNTLSLLKYCNKNCRCSNDADFRPVCDMQGKFIFYSACHAGCTSFDFVDDVKVYQQCSCVEEMLGLGNTDAVDGPCRLATCHMGWIIFQVSSVLISVLIASSAVGSIIIIFRSLYPQDKALSIGFHMTWIAFFVYIPAKILYDRIIDRTCIHWGANEIMCHLYDTDRLGNYLCYLSAAITFVGFIFQFLTWVFSRNLRLYGIMDNSPHLGTELQNIQASPLLHAGDLGPGTAKSGNASDDEVIGADRAGVETTIVTVHPATSSPESESQAAVEAATQQNAPLRFGPLGAGNTRTDRSAPAINEVIHPVHSTILETEDELDSSSDDEKSPNSRQRSTEIAYRPLELESDVESDLNGTGPRSRKNVLGKDFDPVLNNIGIASFPVQKSQNKTSSSDEEDYPHEERRRSRTKSIQKINSLSPVQERVKETDSERNGNDNDDGFSKTDSFEYAPRNEGKIGAAKPKSPLPVPYRVTGDFNEVGIPILELDKEPISPTSPVFKIQSIQATQNNFQGHMSRENLDKLPTFREDDIPRSPDSRPVSSEEYKLEDIIAELEVPSLPNSPPPQSSTSSGFGSLPLSEAEEKPAGSTADRATRGSRESIDRSTPTSPSGRKLPTLITDF
ncbi:solute carrier organic anion transporter family member 74D [Athalia rosae]|uniref:solute carrier organic anion transporter family member 74D n=1 Tax=Athalia rosae TaxID=37344 RepID=UPI0020346081|nr:solute carrier organic anion transporter family member 74D [Athalia rosae]XP_012256143.2 solute carrier organic anion transporter family member 74D [Athalia rosae]